MLDSYAPIVGVLYLVSDLFGIAGINIPRAPTLAGGTDPRSLVEDQSAVAAFAANTSGRARWMPIGATVSRQDGRKSGSDMVINRRLPRCTGVNEESRRALSSG